MTTDGAVVELVLSIAGFTAFVVLFIARWEMHRLRQRRKEARLIFVDALLVIAGVELVADALTGFGEPWILPATAIAFVCRGALVAGGVALAATVPYERRREHM